MPGACWCSADCCRGSLANLLVGCRITLLYLYLCISCCPTVWCSFRDDASCTRGMVAMQSNRQFQPIVVFATLRMMPCGRPRLPRVHRHTGYCNTPWVRFGHIMWSPEVACIMAREPSTGFVYGSAWGCFILHLWNISLHRVQNDMCLLRIFRVICVMATVAITARWRN